MQSIIGSMNLPHGGLQVLETGNSRYVHYVGILRMDALGDRGMTQAMRRRMVNTSPFYRRLKHISNVFDTLAKVTRFHMGKNPSRL